MTILVLVERMEIEQKSNGGVKTSFEERLEKAIEKRKRNTNASTMIIVVINYVGDELRRVTKVIRGGRFGERFKDEP